MREVLLLIFAVVAFGIYFTTSIENKIKEKKEGNKINKNKSKNSLN